MARELTPRQREILEFIQQTILEQGYQPSIREIGRQFGIKSTKGVVDHLKALERKGYISRFPERNRSIVLGPLVGRVGDSVAKVPVLGTVTAGNPVLARENIVGWIYLERDRLPSPDSYFLRVKGDSMIEAHIMDGDLVLVSPQREARRGDIVIALIGDEATVKRFYPEEGRVRLQPENEAMSPIYVNADSPHFRILGVVKSLIRWY